MIVIGLTGPTGAGKGEVAAILARRGALIVDTDGLALEIVQAGSPCLQALAAHFGDDILRADGTLDRARLARKAFSSPAQKAALEAINLLMTREEFYALEL
jgi:dephospho-CoA kinase